MLIRSSCAITDDCYFLTLGDSCFYVLTGETGIHLLDCGAATHVPQLLKRLAEFNLKASDITAIYLSNANPARIAGLPWLKKHAPDASVFCSAALHAHLKDTDQLKKLYESNYTIDKLLPKIRFEPMDFSHFESAFQDLNVLDVDSHPIAPELSLRCMPTPGYCATSTSFYVPELELFLADQTFGYFRGRELPAPGANFSLEDADTSLALLAALSISTLGLHYVGVLTGDLVQKHLQNLKTATNLLKTESHNAMKAGVPASEVISLLAESSYASIFTDPVLLWQLEESLNAIWQQLQ